MTDITDIKQVYIIEGRQFETKAEAQDFLRRPKKVDAFKTFIAAGDNQDKIIDWLLDNQESVESAFEAGVIKRVSKSETKQLEVAFAEIAAAAAEGRAIDTKKARIVLDNIETARDSFRWPTVKRMNDEEKAAEALRQLTEVAEGNERLAQFVVENKDRVLESYAAGKPKREVSPQAAAGLQEYRERMAREKAEREAKAAEGADATTEAE